MKTKLKQSLVLTLAFILCMASIPFAAFADAGTNDANGSVSTPSETENLQTEQKPTEATSTNTDGNSTGKVEVPQTVPEQQDEKQDGQASEPQQASLPVVWFRTHALDAEQWANDEGWATFDSHQKALEEAKKNAEANTTEQVSSSRVAFDAIELKCDDEVIGNTSYRVRNLLGTWQETWTSAPNAATSEGGITGIQLHLPDEAINQYDLWYRAMTADGTWLDWIHDGKELQSSELAALCDLEVLVTKKGDKPTVGKVAEDATDAKQSDEADSTGENADSPIAVVAQTSDADQSSNATEDKKPTASSSSDSSDALQAEAATPSVEYRTHVQNIGWQDWVKDGELGGTSGKSLRVEGFYFRLKNASGDIRCQAHVQNIGWQSEVGSGTMAGTSGRSLRVEAIKLRLTGNIANTHDIYYRGHVQNIGWQAWKKNGQIAGTSGRSLRVEAIEVVLVRKGTAGPTNGTDGITYNSIASGNPGVRYQAHVQNIGWQNEVTNGAVAGTSGKSLRVEAIHISTMGIDGGIRYRMHVQNIGWQDWKSNGAMAGTSGRSLRVEAMQIELTGKAKDQYSVYYRTHVQNVGWMAWAKDGEMCGSSGRSWRMEALQIMLLPHNATPPSNSGSYPMPYLGDLSVTYNTHAVGGNWLGNKSNGDTGGTTGVSGRIDFINATVSGATGAGIRYAVCSDGGKWQSWAYNSDNAGQSGKKITAIRFELTGNAASLYDVWYRAHCANKGWLGWAKNGASAGADSAAYPVEAYQVKIVAKGSSAPGSVSVPYFYSRQLYGVDVSGHDWGNGSSARTLRLSEVEGDFFIIKATEGVQGTIYNTRYKLMAEQALSTGRLIGFYHYANGGDAIAEADSFYNAIKDYKGRAIACLDWEGAGNKLFDTGKDVAWCKKFLDRLKLRFGGTPLLYTSKSYTNAYNWSSVASSYPLWGAEYPDYDDVYGYQSNPWQSSRKWGAWGTYPTIHQYTSTGVLSRNGGCEYFDCNVFYGSASDWRRLQG